MRIKALRRLLASLLILSCFPETTIAQQSTTDNESKLNLVTLETSEGKLDALLLRESEKAKSMGLVPIVQVKAEWCYPCVILRQKMGLPIMTDALSGSYIIQLDRDAWGSEMERLAMIPEGVPVFMEISEKGKWTGEAIDGRALEAPDPDKMAPELKEFVSASVARSKG